MKNIMELSKITFGIFLYLAVAIGKSNANLIDNEAWTTFGNVSSAPGNGNGFYFLVSSTGMFGGTPNAGISQTISTTPGNSYEVQFFTIGFSLTHPFDTFGQLQFGSSAVIFEGKNDQQGSSSRFDSIFVATSEQTLITLSFDANPALGFMQASVQGPFSSSVMNVVDLPDTCQTAILLMLGLTALFVTKRFIGLKFCTSAPSGSNSY